jgi:hypothetical protein
MRKSGVIDIFVIPAYADMLEEAALSPADAGRIKN